MVHVAEGQGGVGRLERRLYFFEEGDATVYVEEHGSQVRILAPPEGLGEMSAEEILELLRASSKIGRLYEAAGRKVSY